MALFVTVVIGGPAQAPIFSTCWPIAATMILSRGLGCVDPSGQGRALKPRAAGAVITTIFITPTFLVIPASSFGLGGLRAMRRHGLCLVKRNRMELWSQM